MTNPSKAKGTQWETQVVDYLSSQGFRPDRIALAGNQDRGDIIVHGSPFVIEAKNCKTMALAEWVDEAGKEAAQWPHAPHGVVWHHRRGKGSPAQGYVTMSGVTFTAVMARLAYLEAEPSDDRRHVHSGHGPPGLLGSGGDMTEPYYYCAECGEPIPDDGTDNRHTRFDGADVHEQCCATCHKDDE